MPSSYEYTELIVLRLLELNSLIPHYWSEFFVLSFQLLDSDQQLILKKRLNEIEEMVLEKDVLYNIYKCNQCKLKFRTKKDWFEIQGCPKCQSPDLKIIRDRQSLYDIEMAMESNRDFNAFFLRYGDRVTKFDIERKLMLVKTWIFQIIRELASSRRFKRFR